jgi:hypothetical protein
MKRWGKALPAALFVIGLFLLFSTAPALAASGKLVVTVYEVDEDGERAVLPGAQVILSDADGQFPPMGQTTNAQGQTTFGVVPAGKNYVLTVKFPGFATTRRDGVQIFAEQTSQIAMAVTPERVEEVEVIGKEQVIELEKGGQTETEVSGEFFQDLPVQGREYQNILELAAGVQDLDDDGNPNVHGARSTEFQMNVDGISNVDPLTGQFQSRINADAIEEMRIVDSGADASYGGAAGGYGEIITKEGGNEFDGTFNFFFRDDAFDNDQAGNRDPQDFGVIRPSIYVSGPIVKDHLWYMASHELYDAEFPVDLVGGTDFVRSEKRLIHRDKLTWQVTPKNKLQLQFSADPLEAEPLAVSSVRPPETGVSYERSGPSFTLTWTSPFSPTFFWEATVGFSNINIDYEPFVRGNPNSCISPDQTDVRFSGDKERWTTMMCDEASRGNFRSGTFFQDYGDERTRWTYAVDAEQYVADWLGGQHRIKFGMNVQQAQYSRDLIQRDELDQQLNAGAFAAIKEFGQDEAATNVLAHRRYFPFRNINTSTGDTYALYVNDSYEPRPNLRINVGLRVSREELASQGFEPFDPATERAAWGRFLLGDTDNPRQPTMDSCLDQVGVLGEGDETGFLGPTAAIDYCQGLFLLNNDSITLDNPFIEPVNLEDNGGFTYQNPLLSDGTPLNPQLNENLANLQRIYEQDGWAAINGPAQLSARDRQKYTIANNSIAPRVSVAWDPWDDGKTKVSANWGRYYQNTFLAPLVDELGPFVSTIFYNQTIDGKLASAGARYGEVPGAQSPSITVDQVARNLERQYTDEYGLGIEREIAPETTLSVRYLNRKFFDKLQDIDVNRRPVTWEKAQRVLPADWLANRCEDPIVIGGVEYADCTGEFEFETRQGGGISSPIARAQGDGRPDLERVNPYFNQVYKIGNFNAATYEAYIVELERRYYRNWELRASYTWSEALGQAEEYNQSLGDDLTNAEDEFGPLSYDVRHQVKVSGRLLVPWYGGIRLGGFLTYRTGTPYSIIEQEVVPDFPLYLDEGFLPKNLLPSNPRALTTVRTFFPTGQRNDQRNPAVWNIDVNAQKEFMIGDVRATVQFDIFNLLNDNTQQTVLVVRDSDVDVDGDGVVEDSEFVDTPIAGRRPGRSFQLAFKLDF